tara:strand:+ start:31 stop:615 length:585 start_codon:yes stop_codon:yes gene_type:complete
MAINFPEGTQNLPAKIIATKFVSFDDGQQTIFASNSGDTDANWANISNLSITHACLSTSSRLLFIFHCGATSHNNTGDNGSNFRFYNSTDSQHIGVGYNNSNRLRTTASSNYVQSFEGQYRSVGFSGATVHHPNSTASKTYVLQGNPGDSSSTGNAMHINRSHQFTGSSSSGGSGRWLSTTITTMTIHELMDAA